MNRSRPSPSRRDLFRGFRSGSAGRPVASQSSSDPRRTEIGDLLKARRDAMGSYFELRIPVRTPGAIELLNRCLDEIDSLEAQMTVYRDDSELSRINATAYLGPVPVEPGLFQLIERGIEIWEATGGAYDLTSGALSMAWGFFKGPRRVPDPAILADARERTGSEHILLDRVRQTIAFDREGILINLGSIGKGYAIDRAAALVRDHWWPTPGLIHGGQSSVFAIGSPPDALGGRWSIALPNPLDPSSALGVFHLRNRGLGTSGTAYQRFESCGRLYGHIIDPRTGEPPSAGPASVTVLAPTAAEADALSTAFSLMDPEATAAFIRDHPDIGVVFVDSTTDRPTPSVRVLGLGTDDLTLDPATIVTLWT